MFAERSGIYLENLKREKSTIIKASVPVKEFKNVAKIAKESKCKIKIKSKKGLPFILNRYRKRKIFAISLLLVLFSLVILSGFIWNIEITGNETISSEDILNIAKSEGLETGKLKRKVDPKKIVEKIRLERADISWVGINISGTNVVIKIVEADKAPEVINKNDYCNIIAKKDAMIVSANAQNGTLQVKEGDVVKQGSVLIAGWLEGKYTGVRYVHATGQVMAKVWYSKKEKVYYKQNERKQTGNVEKKYSINIKNFAINFYKKLSKFEIYDTINTEKKLKISSNFYLPFELIVKENHEPTTSTSTPKTPTTTSTKPKFNEDVKRGVAAAIWIYGSKSGWGNDPDRKKRLTAKFGASNAAAVQKYINAHANNGDLYNYWVKTGKSKLSQYYYSAFKKGGLADYTGVAWLDGSPTEPEMVLNPEDTQNFIALKDAMRSIADGNNPLSKLFGGDEGAANVLSQLAKVSAPISGKDTTNIGDITYQVTIPIEHVQDYNDFMNQMRKDGKFEKMIRSMTVDQLSGGSKLSKNKYQW